MPAQAGAHTSVAAAGIEVSWIPRFRENDGIRKTAVVKYVTIIENGITESGLCLGCSLLVGWSFPLSTVG